jgi:hypothetical protein
MTNSQVETQAFLQLVLKMAQHEGFIPTTPSFPALTLVRPGPLGQGGRLIFVEIQRAEGRQSSSAQDWHLILESLGNLVEVYTWRPKNLAAITQILKNGRLT